MNGLRIYLSHDSFLLSSSKPTLTQQRPELAGKECLWLGCPGSGLARSQAPWEGLAKEEGSDSMPSSFPFASSLPAEP
jgi:hypothetical protein